MKKLTIKDFEKMESGAGMPVTYRHYTGNLRQVCLEPCLDGYCVGVYDDSEWLIGEKKCTNLPNNLEGGGLKFGEEAHPLALEKAIEIANEMVAICWGCSGGGEHINDSHDHRGEHGQSVDKCPTCFGTGKVQ